MSGALWSEQPHRFCRMNKFEKIGRHTVHGPGDSQLPEGVTIESEADFKELLEAADRQFGRGLFGVFDDLEEECRAHLADRGITWGQEIAERPNLVLSDVRTLVYGSDFPKEAGITIESTESLSEADIRTWDIGHLLYSLLGFRKELIDSVPTMAEADFVYRIFLFALQVERIKFRSMEQHARVRQTLMDSGKKGGSSRKRSDRIRDRNEKIREEGRELLDSGKKHEDVVYYMWVKYQSAEGYPGTERQYRSILRNLKPT